MDLPSLKSGTCSKCGSTEVYNDEGKKKHNQRAYISFSITGGFQVTTYICTKCGYIEEYVADNYLNTGRLESDLEKNWNKT